MGASQPISALFVLGALSLLPFLLVMCTSFVKIAVVLSILRTAIGTAQVPPTMVITGLAIVLSAYVMAPTAAKVHTAFVAEARPGQQGADLLSSASAETLYRGALRAREPLREFLIKHSASADRILFRDLSRRMAASTRTGGVKPAPAADERDLLVVVPAFVIGQLASAFQIGFLIFVPFLVIDLLVGNVLMALGMHMLSPTSIALPFKLLLFVLVDGWQLLTRGLVLSYV